MRAQAPQAKQMKTLRSTLPHVQGTMAIVARQVVRLLLFLGAWLMVVRPCAGGSSVIFEETGRLAVARVYHTATLLPNGKVLVTGGYDGNNAFATAELYDPATGTWTPTGSLTVARFRHKATLLPNGQVLVSGG